jgi:hypothetical protein
MHAVNMITVHETKVLPQFGSLQTNPSAAHVFVVQQAMCNGFLRLFNFSPAKHNFTNGSHVSNTTSEVGNRSEKPVQYNLDHHISSLTQIFIWYKARKSLSVTYLE